MNLLSWIVFGLIVGAIAHYLEPRPFLGGIIGTIVLGIIGAVLGGFIGDLLFGIGVTGFNLTSFAVAIIGALGVLWASRYYRNV